MTTQVDHLRDGGGSRADGARTVSSFWRKLANVEDRLFTERQVRLYAAGAVFAYVITFVWWGLHQGHWLIGPDGKLLTMDFCWIWVSGHFAASGEPAQSFNPALFSAVYEALFPPGQCTYQFRQFYDYPPTFLFFTYPLGLLPYLAAYAAWMLATAALYSAGVYAIIPRRAAVIAALAPYPVFVNILLGHNGFLTAGLIGLSLASMERQPKRSGIFLGLLTYKPQFGVLFPLALLASRNWRTFASATAATLALGVAATFAFGRQAWPSFIDTLTDRSAGFGQDVGMNVRLDSIYGLLHAVDAPVWLAWEIHGSVAIVVAIVVCVAWAKPLPHALKAAILCIAAVVVTPYVLPYDLCVLSVAVAFLVKDGLTRGFLPGERILMLLSFGSLFRVVMAPPIAPIVCAVLLGIVVRRMVAIHTRGSASNEDVTDRARRCLSA